MAAKRVDELKRVGSLTMSELLKVGKVAIGPGFGDRVRAALEDEPAAGGSLVLVADGDEDILGLLSMVLEEDGHEVVEAQDGERAVMLALERRPDLCVLDAGLAGLDGVRATKLLRAADQTSRMPIVLLSTGVRPERIDEGEAAGADAHLIKPFVPDDLARSVRELLPV